MQLSNGTIIEHDESDFTRNLAIEVSHFVKKIDVPGPRGFQNYHVPLSISHILQRNKKLCSNPRRLVLKRTRAGSKLEICRHVLNPDDIRQHGKARWFSKSIQGANPQVEATSEPTAEEAGVGDDEAEDSLFVEQAEDDDEGYAEGPSQTPTSEHTCPSDTPSAPQANEDGATTSASQGFESPGRLPSPPASLFGD
ncbi:hypothetical protein CLAFUW4_06960 [Fulvia fulva]|uniref:uncharacterized protein n=1 Tax=Passalora fulva TaxID=5499 RepID=UPI0004EA0B25|nr:uncharacterized protein CLAFUR5_20229 [Fulvia fulva]KAK4622140.1 hypothetical protein CLAFUR4_06969 [Fulvia fulva]KAK4623091.1 hypothetical protein CLAFUR0_06967 [Fulvia fulva]WMI38929.1 hypothetical protein CLAFUR5_20229 [Fulvia fulva]WPV16202.1 hypothetical protein CLAFUW4_06960 [Fulvia fulva]WPV30929.1 hypothetical protein CLAFUW7_06960 [Fulvia fulva]